MRLDVEVIESGSGAMLARGVLVLIVASAAPLGGCVFREIRDEVRTSNAQIGQVESQIESTRGAIDQTNNKLASVEEGLARLDATNLSLADVQERLALLRSIEVSLAKVDHHLASLRKTIGQIDSMIPFLDLGGDAPDATDAPASPAEKAEVAVDAPAEQPQVEGAAKTPAPAKRDAMLGAWVSAYPDDSVALVLMDQGRYLRQSSDSTGKWSTETGAWTREGTSLRFTPDQPPAKETRPGQAVPPVPAASTHEIVSRSVKSLVLRGGDGRLMVFSKP